MERWDGFQNKGDLRAMVAESLPEWDSAKFIFPSVLKRTWDLF